MIRLFLHFNGDAWQVAYRLGYLRGGASEVLKHDWFDGFDWDALVNLSMASPWRPQLKKADDASCFDESVGGDASIIMDKEPPSYAPELEAQWETLQLAFKAKGRVRPARMSQELPLVACASPSCSRPPASEPSVP
jgi:hypothetical protein